MDPCPYLRILVGNLALKFPDSSSNPSPSKIHYCKIKLKSFPDKLVTVTFVLPEQQTLNPDLYSNNCLSVAASFSLNKGQMNRLVVKRGSENRLSDLSIKVYSGGGGGGGGGGCCGAFSSCMMIGCKKKLGKAYVPVDFRAAGCKTSAVVHNGWVGLGKRRNGSCCSSSSPELHVSVLVEPDPRFVFRFGGEPECSPQVFQVKGNHEQAVFTCTFRNSGDRNSLPRLSISKQNSSGSWYALLKSDEDKTSTKERKGWSITIHDLSGSPVAMASMVTPFVQSPGSDRVTQSNPGAWLILRPGGGTWRPWGRLEAWREPTSNALGYNFEFFHDKIISVNNTTTTTAIATSNVTIKNGGKFTIDLNNHITPLTSPRGSGDFGNLSRSDSRSITGSESGSELGSGLGSGSGLSQPTKYKGFVMSSTMDGVDKCSKPEVVVGVQHVTCTEDAAAFVALAAAIDLSMDACRLFTNKLRKELRQQSKKSIV